LKASAPIGRLSRRDSVDAPIRLSECPAGAASGVCVAVGDAQRGERTAPDAGLPREGSAVDRLLGGERPPQADFDAPAHRHADAHRERSAVAHGVAKVAPDGLVETREQVRG